MSTADPDGAKVDLSVDVAGIKMTSPVVTASGTSGYGPEFARVCDLRSLGAFVTKAVSVEPRKGNPPDRIYETTGGMLNAIGLANDGLSCFVADKVPYIERMPCPVVVNVVGHSVDDFLAVCSRLDAIDSIAGLELNVSCPNVADGLEFGTDPTRLATLVSEVRAAVKRATLIVKLSPNVTDITATAAAAVDAGADALSAINTLVGMAINIDTWKPMLANRVGGLSGPAVMPVAVRMVHQVYTKVARPAGVPIIGMGGISDWRDAVAFLLAGATAVAVGTALFVDPGIPAQINTGLARYLAARGLDQVGALIGQLK